MGRDLVIARQTAGSEELLDAGLHVAAADPDAAFAVRLPETSLRHLRMVTEGTVSALALGAAGETEAMRSAACSPPPGDWAVSRW